MNRAPTAEDRERMFVDPGPQTYRQVVTLGEDLAWELCLTVTEEMQDGERGATPAWVQYAYADEGLPGWGADDWRTD